MTAQVNMEVFGNTGDSWSFIIGLIDESSNRGDFSDNDLVLS